MVYKKEWQESSSILKELLNLEFSPVALNCLKESALQSSDKKLRICRAILDAGKGGTLQIDKNNNACFGAAWHLGFNKISDKKVIDMVKRFVV